MNRLNNDFLLKVIAIIAMAILLCCTLFLAGCSEVLSKKEPTMISVEKVAEIFKTQKDSYIILDVRTKEEFDSGHLDSALLIPVDELETRYGELSKDKPIIVYCRSGNRSAKAAAILVSKGFSQVYDMTGGINAWTGKGYPVIVESASTTLSDEASNVSQEPQNTNTTSATAAAADNTGISEIKYITANELNAKVTKGEDIIILDVRSEDSFLVKHIKNAINIPYTELQGREGELDGLKEIVIYCSNFDCGLSANAVTQLVKSGFKNVFALKGGIESWQTEGYPVE